MRKRFSKTWMLFLCLLCLSLTAKADKQYLNFSIGGIQATGEGTTNIGSGDMTAQLKEAGILKSGEVTFSWVVERLTLNLQDAQLTYDSADPVIDLSHYNTDLNVSGACTITNTQGTAITAATIEFTGNNTPSTRLSLLGGMKLNLNAVFNGPEVYIYSDGVALGSTNNNCGPIQINDGKLILDCPEQGYPAYFSGAAPAIELAEDYSITPDGVTLQYQEDGFYGVAGSVFMNGTDVYHGKVTISKPTTSTTTAWYPIEVGLRAVSNLTADDVLEDGGSMKYNPYTHTLYMNNAHIAYDFSSYVIHNTHSDKELTVNLEGDNSIETLGGYGFDGKTGIIFTGNGSLHVKIGDAGRGAAILTSGFENGNIELRDNVQLTLEGGKYGIQGQTYDDGDKTTYYTSLKIESQGALLKAKGGTASIADISEFITGEGIIIREPQGQGIQFNNHRIENDNGVVTDWVTIGRDTKLPLRIFGIQVTEENGWNLPDTLRNAGVLNDDGFVFFDNYTNTLHLVNAQLNGTHFPSAISYGSGKGVIDPLNIEVSGDCSVTNGNGEAIFSTSSLNFTEPEGNTVNGTLSLNSGGSNCIVIDSQISMLNGTVTWPLSNEAAGTPSLDIQSVADITSCVVGSGLTAEAKTYFDTNMIGYRSPGKATTSDGSITDTTLMKSVMIEYRVKAKTGWTFKPSYVSYNAVKDGTNNGFYTWSYTADGEESELNVVPAKQIRHKNETYGTDIKHDHNVRDAGYCSEFTFRIYVSGLDYDKILGIGNVVIDGEFRHEEQLPAVTINFNGPDVTATGFKGLQTRDVLPQLYINDGTITFDGDWPIVFIETPNADLNLGRYYAITPADAVLTASRDYAGSKCLLFTDSINNRITGQVVFSKSVPVIPLWIAGIQVTEENAWNLTDLLQEAGKLNEGALVAYNSPTKQLFLYDAQLTGTISNGKQDGSDIIAGIEDLEIMVKGDCSVNVSNDDGIITTAPITFTKNVNGDDGSLTVTGSDGILLLGDGTSTKVLTVKFSGPDVTARSDNWCGMSSWGVKYPRIEIREGTVTFEGPDSWGYPLWLHDVTSASLVRGSGTITPSNAYFRMVTDETTGKRDGVFVDRDNENSIYRGKVVIGKQPVIPGDVNIDGDIDINDVMALVSHICGQTPTQFDYTAADANSDGEIDINDVMRVVDIIVNQ